MKLGIKGITLIKEFESLHDGDLKLIGLQPKMCPAGIWTEGYGTTIRDSNGNFVKGIKNKALAYSLSTIKTEEDAIQALVEYTSSIEVILARKVLIPLNQNQFDALVSYWYNTGGSSTLIKLINQKANKTEIYKWMTTKYISANNKILPGLIRRRKAEADLFFS